MYNLRYHIASLVALFLALALGLVLGGLVVERGAVSRQQENLVKNLQEQFAALRDENRVLVQENELSDRFSQMMSDAWIRGRLEGKTVLVVSNAGRASGVEAAREAIGGAGGVVANVVILKPGLGLADAQVRSAVATLVAAEEDRLLESVCASLVAEWAGTGPDMPVTSALVAADVLRLDGLEPGMPIGALVDVALDDGEAEAAGVQLASAFTAYGPAVAGQMAGEESGVAAAADEAGVSAFDTLGTPVGRYTLVALLSGAKSGYYGTGPGAGSPFPEIPESGR